jgi:AcrR family transcriptional regulator
MDKQSRLEREGYIEDATYRLLEEKGYAATSMLSIAKAAGASNETLYRWYGDKAGLITALVARNAAATREILEKSVQENSDPLKTLEYIAPLLLSMLLGRRAVCLNRAAASDISGQVGAALAAARRDAVMPLIRQVMQRGLDSGNLVAPAAVEAAEVFIGLLAGDLQVRRVNRSLKFPGTSEIADRSRRAIEIFGRLYLPAKAAADMG